MRVTCPNCAAGYEVPDALLQAGARNVRCARCGTKFQAGPLSEPSVEDVPVEALAEPEPAPALAFPRAPPMPADSRVVFHPPMVGPPRASRGRASGPLLGAAGWALTLLLLAGAVYAAVRQREQIMAAWPASTRAYAAVGLNPVAPPAPAPVPPPPSQRPAGMPAAGQPTAGP